MGKPWTQSMTQRLSDPVRGIGKLISRFACRCSSALDTEFAPLNHRGAVLVILVNLANGYSIRQRACAKACRMTQAP